MEPGRTPTRAAAVSGAIPAATEGERARSTHQALRAWTVERQAFEFDRELVWMDERAEPDRQQLAEARDALCELLRRLVRVGDSPAGRRDDEVRVATAAAKGLAAQPLFDKPWKWRYRFQESHERRAPFNVLAALGAIGLEAAIQSSQDQACAISLLRAAHAMLSEMLGKASEPRALLRKEQMSAPELTAVSAYAARMERVVAGCVHGRRRMLESMLVRRPRASLRTEMGMRAEMRTIFSGTLHEVEDLQDLPSRDLPAPAGHILPVIEEGAARALRNAAGAGTGLHWLPLRSETASDFAGVALSIARKLLDPATTP